MRVVLLRHARIAVPKIVGDDIERHARHNEMRRCRVPQNVEAPVRDACGPASLRRGSDLVTSAPCLAVRMGEHQGIARTSSCQRFEKPPPFISDNNVAGLAALALPDKDRSRIRVEVANAKTGQLAISATREQGGLDEIPKIALRGIDQPPTSSFVK